MADPARHLGGDDSCSRSAERLINRLPRTAVVLDGTLHAFHGLLRAVAGVVLDVLNSPNRRLLPITSPMRCLAFLHRVISNFMLRHEPPVIVLIITNSIQRRLMLPMVRAARKSWACLYPHDLSTETKLRCFERVGHGRRVQAAMPNVRHSARKQRPRLTPVCAVIVQNHSQRSALGPSAYGISP